MIYGGSSREYPTFWDNINAILSMLQFLHHGDKRRPCISFFIYACQVAVHFYYLLQQPLTLVSGY
jgi:hypothetical protein